MSNKQLLIEHALFTPMPGMLKEGRGGNGNLIVAGKVQAADKPNANRRVYPFDYLQREVAKYQQLINERRATGELDHPETAVINLKNVCHNITKLWWEGTDLYGEFEILNTPSGNILKELFRSGITVGVSSRALGSVSQLSEDLVRVEDDLEIICWDFVSTPSTFGAYVTPQGSNGLNESLTYTNVDKYHNVNIAIRETLCLQTGICCLR